MLLCVKAHRWCLVSVSLFYSAGLENMCFSAVESGSLLSVKWGVT